MSANPKSAADEFDNRVGPPPRRSHAASPQETTEPVRAPEKGEEERPPLTPARKRPYAWDFRAAGEPFVWSMGGALVIGILMIIGFLIFVVYNGILTFYPEPLYVVKLKDNKQIAGEFFRAEVYKLEPEALKGLPENVRKEIADQKGFANRNLYRIGNFDLYNEDFRWTPTHDIVETSTPKDMFFVERVEWGPFIGRITKLDLNGQIIQGSDVNMATLDQAVAQATKRRARIRQIERSEMGEVNHHLEKGRLGLRKVALSRGEESPEYRSAKDEYEAKAEKWRARHEELAREAESIKERDGKYTITLAEVNGQEKQLKLSDIVRLYPANRLTVTEKLHIYLSRWWEFLSQEPREANTEGGVMPAIFGTFCMTALLALAVAPFGVVAALYLREYAKQGRVVSLVRICVNNLAGVPSIVYGIFGLGFFAYLVGGSIDQLFFPERLPSPTFGTGGLLWASLTLALLTVPVVIVATEEALAAVPQSMREGSLACGASKWQTIKHIVLPRAMPGIMTGLILAMARGAQEVAPLMLVGVVKIAPELPIDGIFPYLHLERSFMHLGFHIYDVGFQSRNSEAARPMVYVTTLLLIGMVLALNAASIVVRNRLKKKFLAGHF